MLAVLITYHNEGPLLVRCLESLDRQEGLPEEIWVYDDASRLPAAPWVDKAALSPLVRSRVRVERGEQNAGPAKARNRLARLTQASYIHFHDTDDVFLPGWAQAVVGAFAAGPDLVLTELRSRKAGQCLSEAVIGLRALGSPQGLAEFALGHAILPAAATYRRDFFLLSGGYREDLWQSEDYELHIRLGLAGARFTVVPEALVELDVRDESRSQKQVEVWECRLRALELLDGSIPAQLDSALAEAYAVAGAKLTQLGCKNAARRAWEASARRGGARYLGRPWGYRAVARCFGPAWAEWLGQGYRAALPAWFRRPWAQPNPT